MSQLASASAESLNMVGKAVPSVTFRVQQEDGWQDITSESLFRGKTVIVFSLPGAFTPTCSSTHLPRFNELAPIFAENGIDSIICMSVNDTFVMNAWKQQQQAQHIAFIPDGNGEFTAGMGMLVDKKELGFGQRSWRYSMLVKDGIVDKMFVEPKVPGDPFQVSDADTMLRYINPGAEKPASVAVLTKPGCPYCTRAKQLLAENEVAYEEIILGKHATSVGAKAISGSVAVPQVFVDGEHIGGSDDLVNFLQNR